MPKEPVKGDGWAVADLDDLGDGPGFRKVRQALDVTEFGVNAVVLPPGQVTRRHYHERQQELYLVLRGEIEFDFGDGTTQRLGPGGLARVDAATVRRLRNVSDREEATYFCVGAAGGYVGRDGVRPDD
jgi:quercetin dioxygenase-like cupin family protein